MENDVRRFASLVSTADMLLVEKRGLGSQLGKKCPSPSHLASFEI